VVVLWTSGQTIDWFARGDPRVFARSAHIALGALLAIVLAYRLTWRLTRGARLPGVGSVALARAATATHWLLYALLVIGVLLGITNAWVRGDNLFNLFTIPSFSPGNKALAKQVNGYHEWAANAILVVAALHAAAGLVHHYVLKDAVLRRMLRRRSA
jgi:cytochrome b561